MLEPIAKLKWRCRRGTKELDYLLDAYLENHYNPSSHAERALFVELLNLQDAQLMGFLLGEQLPESIGLTTLVKKIRSNTDF